MKNPEFMQAKLDQAGILEKIFAFLERLEQKLSTEDKHIILMQLYLLSMGEYTHAELTSPRQKKNEANKLINQCDGLRAICVLFYQKIVEMGEVESKKLDDENILLELELRLICNILINFCLYNNDDPNMVKDLTSLDYLVEETCLLAIKHSLDTSFVPVRKIILIFHIYLRYLFGEKKEDPEHKKKYSNMRYIKELVDYRSIEKVPRY